MYQPLLRRRSSQTNLYLMPRVVASIHLYWLLRLQLVCGCWCRLCGSSFLFSFFFFSPLLPSFYTPPSYVVLDATTAAQYRKRSTLAHLNLSEVRSLVDNTLSSGKINSLVEVYLSPYHLPPVHYFTSSPLLLYLFNYL